MLVLAFLILVMPLAAIAFTFGAGLQLSRARRIEGHVTLIGVLMACLLMVWEMRYDIGLELPDLPINFPMESAIVTVACALTASLAVSLLRWPANVKGRWSAVVALLCWALAIVAYFTLSSADFRH